MVWTDLLGCNSHTVVSTPVFPCLRTDHQYIVRLVLLLNCNPPIPGESPVSYMIRCICNIERILPHLLQEWSWSLLFQTNEHSLPVPECQSVCVGAEGSTKQRVIDSLANQCGSCRAQPRVERLSHSRSLWALSVCYHVGQQVSELQNNWSIVFRRPGQSERKDALSAGNHPSQITVLCKVKHYKIRPIKTSI